MLRLARVTNMHPGGEKARGWKDKVTGLETKKRKNPLYNERGRKKYNSGHWLELQCDNGRGKGQNP